MYILTTLGNCYMNVWEQEEDDSSALFKYEYSIDIINELWMDIKSKNKVFAIGLYAPYWGMNGNIQGQLAQYDHSSLLLIKDIEFSNNQRNDTKIKFKLLDKISPDKTRKIFELKGKPIPLIDNIPDNIFFKSIRINLTSYK